ncbi:MAG TPA: GtrA family protein [Candidatus Accumulibacter phosphatis]|nr:MAG: GtrA-like protein [Candidatus Accumulibacter sp. SK-11]HAY27306.1 GtrA family protein [Accumulibacter sp.]HRL76428.1 GtrA family protein [Candidatus Accumulibacter phosphatis]HCN67461.1 GtrA family protein [Accumulibacter sp.]HCV13938.1 GtrA family protein [Accumulibacter sp.]
MNTAGPRQPHTACTQAPASGEAAAALSESQKFARFLMVGVVNTIAGYSVILLLQYGAGLSPLAANAGGYLVGWAVSYVLSRRFVFQSKRSHSDSLPRYVIAALSCYGINAAVLHGSLTLLGLPGAAAQAVAMASYTVSFYLVNRYVVFRHPDH